MDNNDFDKYQDFTGTVAIYPPETGLVYTACGLAGEAGEYCGKIKDFLISQDIKNSSPEELINWKEVINLLSRVESVGRDAEILKKSIRGGSKTLPEILEPPSKVQIKELAKELSDQLWYCAQAAKNLGYKLSEIVTLNIEKLSSRAARGKLDGEGDNR